MKSEILVKIIKIGDYIFEGKYLLHSTFGNISNFIDKEKNIVSVAHDEKYLSPNSIIISGTSHKDVALIVISASVEPTSNV